MFSYSKCACMQVCQTNIKQMLNNYLKDLRKCIQLWVVKAIIIFYRLFQNVSFPLKRIVRFHAVYTVSTRRVTESTVVVCMAVNMGTNVTKVYCSVSRQRTNILFTISAFYLYAIHSVLHTLSKIFFTVYFLDSVKHTISFSSSNNLPVTIGGLVFACILIIAGVVIAVFVIR